MIRKKKTTKLANRSRGFDVWVSFRNFDSVGQQNCEMMYIIWETKENFHCLVGHSTWINTMFLGVGSHKVNFFARLCEHAWVRLGLQVKINYQLRLKHRQWSTTCILSKLKKGRRSNILSLRKRNNTDVWSIIASEPVRGTELIISEKYKL